MRVMVQNSITDFNRWMSRGLLLLMLISVYGIQPGYAVERVPDEARHAAEAALQPLLEAIPEEDLYHFNLSKIELPAAVIGNGFRLNTIFPDALAQSDSSSAFSSLLTKAPVFLFPVISNKQMKALIYVERRGGKWSAVSLGSAGVAQQWDLITTDWEGDDGFGHDFIRVYQALSDLVLITPPTGRPVDPDGNRLGKPALVLMNSARIALSTKERPLQDISEVYDTEQIIPLLKERVNKTISGMNDSAPSQLLD
ncbi:MAG: hypothetical protein CL388_09035 [Acidiferrobacteraceae bacterium]|nr:hypothetical protein [Acidiferrobacteraceae bacterium]MDP6123990.1 hypothetical protein [Arenicellales bacterium]